MDVNGNPETMEEAKAMAMEQMGGVGQVEEGALPIDDGQAPATQEPQQIDGAPQGIEDDSLVNAQQAVPQAASQQEVPAQQIPITQSPEFIALQQQNQQLMQMLTEQGEMMKNGVMNSAINPTAEQQVAQAQAVEDEITRDNIMDKFYEDPYGVFEKMLESKLGGVQGTIEEIKSEKQAAQENTAWMDALTSMAADTQNYPRFAELQESMAQILDANPYLKNGDKVQSLANAYLIAQGMQAKQAPDIKTQINDDGFLEQMIQENPDFLKKIAMIQAKNANSQQVPPLSASSGAVNAALNIPSIPKTLDEARERTEKMFGN